MNEEMKMANEKRELVQKRRRYIEARIEVSSDDWGDFCAFLLNWVADMEEMGAGDWQGISEGHLTALAYNVKLDEFESTRRLAPPDID